MKEAEVGDGAVDMDGDYTWKCGAILLPMNDPEAAIEPVFFQIKNRDAWQVPPRPMVAIRNLTARDLGDFAFSFWDSRLSA
jgi:hypothetical protein